MTSHWNNFSSEQRLEIRNYILTYIANRGPALENFVLLHLVQLVCRITKLGWFDHKTHRDLVKDLTKFLQVRSVL